MEDGGLAHLLGVGDIELFLDEAVDASMISRRTDAEKVAGPLVRE